MLVIASVRASTSAAASCIVIVGIGGFAGASVAIMRGYNRTKRERMYDSAASIAACNTESSIGSRFRT
jgi:hypothetical protein